MKDIPVADTRAWALMGHTGSGKTTLIEAMLFKLGLNDRLGLVSNGTSMADYTDEEKGRKITLAAKPFNMVYKTVAGKKTNQVILDTPGYMDFHGQVICAANAVESALIVVDAASGVGIGARLGWKACERRGLARGVVITGLDRENTSYEKAFEGMKAVFGDACVPVVLPTADLKGVVDVMGAKDIPADLKAKADEARNALAERAAETDDALIEKYLGGEKLTEDELAKGLRKAVLAGKLVPVFVCMALKDPGVTDLLEGIVRLFPSPADVQPKDAEGKAIVTEPAAPFVGYVWRSVNDPFVGQVSFVRVLGGTLRPDSEVQNASKDQKERVSTLLAVNGKKQANLPEAAAGEIVALPKLKATGVCDTLCAVGQKVVCAKMKFPSPVMIVAVRGKTQADDDKIGTALSRVADDDPTLRMERNTETREVLLSGLGDVHIDVAVERMKSRSHVEVMLSTPKVPYRETVTALGEGHYRHKKQSGGRGQYGEVYLKIQPKRADDEEWFEDAIVGGAIPGNFVPAVQKGVVEGMTAGSIAGYPVMNVKVTVYDGSYHDVDSSEIAFKIASSRAFKDGMAKARPVLLEPIMTVKVMVPDHYLGDINGDLNQRRGRILGMGPEDGMQVITAEVPQVELFRYAAELRSITAGQGSFEMEFNRYDVVPSNVAQKVVAASAKQKQEPEE